MTRRRLSRAGFTILEILIAIVVLVLGITGIIALFPTAIESGNKTVEDSYAAAITQSVVDALTVGIRESRYTTRQGSTTYTYFIFNHDGVIDVAPQAPAAFDNAANPTTGQGAMWRRDYCIILPVATGGAGNLIQNEPNFIYPVPTYLDPVAFQNDTQRDGDPGLNQRRGTTLANPANLVDNLDTDFQRFSSQGNATVPWISRVYHLGRYRQPAAGNLPNIPGTTTPMQPGDVRLEYLGETVTVAGNQQQAIAADPYPSYGFAFTLQRARVDTAGATPGSPPDGRLTPLDMFSDSLYTLRVMIFKNFDEAAAYPLRPKSAGDLSPVDAAASVPRSNVRIREFVTLIAL